MIIKWEAFKEATDNNSIVKRSRGPQIERVDNALQAYWSGSKGTPQAHVLLLHGIIDACLGWLNKKKGKAIVTKGLFGKRVENKVFGKRKQAISSLANSALYDLNELLLIHDLYTADNRGKINFNNNKLRTLGMHGFGGDTRRHGKQTISMDSHYQIERTMYLHNKDKNKVKTSISANQVSDVFDGIKRQKITENNFNRPSFLAQQSQQEQNNFTNMANRTIQKVFRNGIDNLTMEEYTLLDQIANVGNQRRDFDVLSRNSRYAHMAIPGHDGLLYDVNNQLITTQTYAKDKEYPNLYAMDKYGNIIFKILDGLVQEADLPEGRAKANRFNHSSFNAAGDVICAGKITIKDGRLMGIDNDSGHYKPNRSQVHKCISILYHDGVDLSQCTVTITEYSREEYSYQERNRNRELVTITKVGNVKYTHLLPASKFVTNQNLKDPDCQRKLPMDA